MPPRCLAEFCFFSFEFRFSLFLYCIVSQQSGEISLIEYFCFLTLQLNLDRFLTAMRLRKKKDINFRYHLRYGGMASFFVCASSELALLPATVRTKRRQSACSKFF